MSRAQRTEAELKEASNHLHSEILMLKYLAHDITSGEIKDFPLKQAILDSFTMHARILLDFLFPKDPQPDEVMVEDFIAAMKWKSVRPAKSVFLQKYHERLRKKSAFLSYAQPQSNSEIIEWKFVQVTDEIAGAFKEFLSIVPQNFLGSKWTSGSTNKETDVKKI